MIQKARVHQNIDRIPMAARKQFLLVWQGLRFLWLLGFLLAAPSVWPSWGEPVLVRQASQDLLADKDRSVLLAVSPDARYFFYSVTRDIEPDIGVTSELVIIGPEGRRLVGYPPYFTDVDFPSDPSAHSLTFLKGSSRVIASRALIDYQTGRLIRTFQKMGKILPLPDGGFVAQPYYYSDNRFNDMYVLYDQDGNYLRALGRQEMETPYFKALKPPVIILGGPATFNFTDKNIFYESKAYPVTFSDIKNFTHFGWVALEVDFSNIFPNIPSSCPGHENSDFPGYFSPRAFAFNYSGQLISIKSFRDDKVYADIQTRFPNMKAAICIFSYGYWNDHGDFFFEYKTAQGVEIYKIPWTDDPKDIPLYTPRIVPIPRDGDGAPRTFTAADSTPGPSRPGETGALALSFHYPEPLQFPASANFPVHDLCEYNWAAYRREKPAGQGALPNLEDWFALQIAIEGPVILGLSETADMRQYPKLAADVESHGRRTRSGEWKEEGKITKFHHYVFTVGGRSELDDSVMFIQMHDRNARPERFKLNLDPRKPDALNFAMSFGGSPSSGHNSYHIETGADTKIFVAPTVQTNIWLTPHHLPKDQRATLKAYSRNWRTGKDHTVDLVETAPGSRKFTNQAGDVIYELPFVLDQQTNLVEQPSPDDLNFLYFYITDPLLGLNRLPQYVTETGADSGEYYSWNRADYRPMKPWSQVQDELSRRSFNVEATGTPTGDNPTLIVTWTDGFGKKQTVRDEMVMTAPGHYRTLHPLVAFSKQGCDVEGLIDPDSYLSINTYGSNASIYGEDFPPTNGRSAKVPTPAVDGALAIRYTQDLQFSVESYRVKGK